MKSKTEKPKLFVGKAGTGKTFNAICEMGKKDYEVFYANDIAIDDIFSYPKDMGMIIEDLHESKIEKDKIVDIILSGRTVALTSRNKKDVPKSIVNLCQVKYPGKYDRRQVKIKLMAKNAEEVINYEKPIFDICMGWIKAKDRSDYYRVLDFNQPAPMQLISWLSATDPTNEKLAFAASVMHRWPVKYLYALVAYSKDGGYGRVNPPKRSSSNPLTKICKRLGLKEGEVYLLRHLLRDPEYKKYATKKLSREDCKVLGLKKPTRKRETKRKIKSLEEF